MDPHKPQSPMVTAHNAIAALIEHNQATTLYYEAVINDLRTRLSVLTAQLNQTTKEDK